MTVYINDKSYSFSGKFIKIHKIIDKLNLKNKNIVILKGGKIIDDRISLKDGDKIDIVSFIGGG